MTRFAWIGPGVGLLLGMVICPILFCSFLWLFAVRDGSSGPIYDAINGPDAVGGKQAVVLLGFIFDAVAGALGGALAGQAIQQVEARGTSRALGALGLASSGIWIWGALESHQAVETHHWVSFDPFSLATASPLVMLSMLVLATGFIWPWRA